MSALLVAALLLALGVIAHLLVYKAQHKYTEEDLRTARNDSVARSRAVVSGKVQEHLAPLLPEFVTQFNPKDARFLGTPVDFVVFDGLDEGYVQRVVFVEVKTGNATITSRERRVRAAIGAGKVKFQLLRLGGEAAGNGATPETPEARTARTALQP